MFLPAMRSSVPKTLAYVEWYSPFTRPDRDHLMYKVSPCPLPDSGFLASIIPLANIRRSIHLIPQFGPAAPPEWTSSNVLDLCKSFYVNTFTDRHLYRILY